MFLNNKMPQLKISFNDEEILSGGDAGSNLNSSDSEELENKPLGEKGEKALKAIKNENKTLKRQLRELQTKLSGVDPDEYARLKEIEQQRQEEELTKKNDWEKLKSNYQSKAKEAEDKARAYQEKYNQLIIRSNVSEAFYKAGGKKEQEFVEMLLLKNKDVFRINEEEQVYVSDPQGNPRLNDKGEEMSVEEYIESLKETALSAFFEPSNRLQGGGMTQSSQRLTKPVKPDFKEISRLLEMGHRGNKF